MTNEKLILFVVLFLLVVILLTGMLIKLLEDNSIIERPESNNYWFVCHRAINSETKEVGSYGYKEPLNATEIDKEAAVCFKQRGIPETIPNNR